jgi:methylglutaconyl-CoA hydratase
VVFGFNRPKQKNALSAGLVEQIKSALQKVTFDAEARVVVLRSLVPGVFCAGKSPVCPTVLQVIFQAPT